MTTTTSPTDTDRRQLAELLLRRSGLTLVDGVDPDQLVGMLAKVLYQHHPSNTDHGRLLLIALIPREGPRSPAEVAVQKLVARGQAPTPVAVAGQVRTTEAAALAAAARKARLRPQVDQAGPAAALTVEDLWQQRGKAPSPRMVGLTLGWAKADTWPLTVLLVEAGWLCNEHRRLTPGSRARGPDTGPAP